MSKDIKETENLTDDKVEEVIEKTEETVEETEDALAEIAKDKEAKLQAKLEKKEAKKAAKQAKKAAKKSADSQDNEQSDNVGNADVSEGSTAVKEGKESDESSNEDEPAPKKIKRKKEKEEKNPEDINIVSELLNLIIYIGIVVLICYFVITFVGCRSRVDGDSMNPTLEDGDNLWVDKLSYTFGDPDRFDVIIFNYNEDTTYVKRIIGLPGETVRIDINGNIYINNKLLVESYGNEVIQPTNIGRASVDVVLGEGEYFVLGDNRNNSSDSRWPDVGNVHEDDILGKVVLRIYPFTSIGAIK